MALLAGSVALYNLLVYYSKSIGAVGGFISPHAHQLISAGGSYTDILASRASDSKQTDKIKASIDKAAEKALKYDKLADTTACCFCWPAKPEVWHYILNCISGILYLLSIIFIDF